MKHIHAVSHLVLLLVYFGCYQVGLAQSVSPRLPTDLFSYWSQPVPGNLTEPLNTGLSIQTGDYVYVEAHGQVKVGNYFGYAGPAGLLNPPFLSLPGLYTKYKGQELGAVIVGIGSQQVACERMFHSSSHPIYNAMVDKSRMDTENGYRNFVPGVYFLATSTGRLTLDVNDSIATDNEGQYLVEVFVMRRANHLMRNKFNTCPAQEPDEGTVCAKGGMWKKESLKSVYYHGVGNTSYRGSGRRAGCQCVYDGDGTLLTAGQHIGSFDIGFWIGKSDETDPAATHRHLILDVLPHDLYESTVGINSYTGQTTYTCK